MVFNLNEWYENKKDGEVLLSYKGDISSGLITDVLEIIETKLEEKEVTSKIRKKIYNTLVECLQNIFHHLDELPSENNSVFNGRFALFTIIKDNDVFRISTGNFVKNDKIHLLSDRLNQINSLSKEELKSLYKLILNNHDFSEKGGGGLGMIDIARKTGSKLDYNFNIGTSFTAWKGGSMFSTYINPNLKYKFTPKFSISTGVVISNNTLLSNYYNVNDVNTNNNFVDSYLHFTGIYQLSDVSHK